MRRMELFTGIVIGVILGAAASYLVLRNNPRHRAKLDEQVDKLDERT